MPSAAWSSAEYFVSPAGDDSSDGLSEEAAFASIQRGVNALAAGDTLTILPGEYFGTVRGDGIGGEGVRTRIRARIPGTVLVRGDVAAPQFEPVDGYERVWSAVIDGPVEAVNEVDTLTILSAVPNIDEVEANPGSYFFDPVTGVLYVSSSDTLPVSGHRYTISRIAGCTASISGAPAGL